MSASAFAQLSSFPTPSYFRETFRKPDTKVVLQPPARLADFVKGGQLELSLKDYLELVMANNTQVATSYLSLETSRNSILSAHGAFDPSGTASFTPSWTRTDPARNMWEGDPSRVKSHSDSFPISLGYSQKLETGQTISFSGGGSKSVRNSTPSFGSNFGFTVSQPLLRDRGRYITRMSIMTAEVRYKGSDLSLRNTLLNYVNSAEGYYWSAVKARETIKSSTAALVAAQASYDYIHRQLSLGAISELDTYGSESALAGAKLTLTQAQFSLRTAEESVRQQISADLDPSIRNLPLSLTEPVEMS
jgi:outer membrane protein